MPQPTETTPARAGSPKLLIAIGLVASSGIASASLDRDRAARLRADSIDVDSLTPFAGEHPENPIRGSLLLQTRYAVSVRSDDLVPSIDQNTFGFSQPRAQVRLDSHIVSEQLIAHLTLDFGDASGARGRGNSASNPAGMGVAQLRSAYVQYNFAGDAEGYYLKAGQDRMLLLGEDMIEPEFLMAADRSVANEFFSPGYTQGISFGRVTDRVAWEISISDGADFLGSNEPANTPFNSVNEADYALTGRFDYKALGDWSAFEDFTSWTGSDQALRIGGAVHVQQTGRTNPTSTTPTTFFGTATNSDVVIWTVDAQYEDDGWSLYAGYMGRHLVVDFTGGVLRETSHGFVVQGASFVGDDIEVFARWDGIVIDSLFETGFGTDGNEFNFLTFGANYYPIPESHAAKLTADVTFAPDSSETLEVGNTSNFFFPDPSVTGLVGMTRDEVVIRLQLQLLF